MTFIRSYAKNKIGQNHVRPTTYFATIFSIASIGSCFVSIGTASEVYFPSIKATSLLPLTNDKIKLVSFASTLSNAAYNETEAINLNATYYNTGADAALTLATDDYCFIAFRGSLLPSIQSLNAIEDWLFQNMDFDPLFVTNRNNGSIGCYVQRGFHDAYIGIGVQNIYSFVDQCMSEGKKQLVFTGHSQGGATAAIASVIDIDYNPLTITFGQPSFQSPGTNCSSVLNAEHLWRFINTENSANGLQYDPIPFVDVIEPSVLGDKIGSQFGASLYLPPNNEPYHNPVPFSMNSVYHSADDVESFMSSSTLDIAADTSTVVSSHLLAVYIDKIFFLDFYGADPLDVNGYIPGTLCNFDFECSVLQGGSRAGLCNNNLCMDSSTTKRTDGSCDSNNDCSSGRCEYTEWFGMGDRVCYVPKPSGSLCSEDSDCQTGTCTWMWICS